MKQIAKIVVGVFVFWFAFAITSSQLAYAGASDLCKGLDNDTIRVLPSFHDFCSTEYSYPRWSAFKINSTEYALNVTTYEDGGGLSIGDINLEEHGCRKDATDSQILYMLGAYTVYETGAGGTLDDGVNSFKAPEKTSGGPMMVPVTGLRYIYKKSQLETLYRNNRHGNDVLETWHTDDVDASQTFSNQLELTELTGDLRNYEKYSSVMEGDYRKFISIVDMQSYLSAKEGVYDLNNIKDDELMYFCEKVNAKYVHADSPQVSVTVGGGELSPVSVSSDPSGGTTYKYEVEYTGSKPQVDIGFSVKLNRLGIDTLTQDYDEALYEEYDSRYSVSSGRATITGAHPDHTGKTSFKYTEKITKDADGNSTYGDEHTINVEIYYTKSGECSTLAFTDGSSGGLKTKIIASVKRAQTGAYEVISSDDAGSALTIAPNDKVEIRYYFCKDTDDAQIYNILASNDMGSTNAGTFVNSSGGNSISGDTHGEVILGSHTYNEKNTKIFDSKHIYSAFFISDVDNSKSEIKLLFPLNYNLDTAIIGPTNHGYVAAGEKITIQTRFYVFAKENPDAGSQIYNTQTQNSEPSIGIKTKVNGGPYSVTGTFDANIGSSFYGPFNKQIDGRYYYSRSFTYTIPDTSSIGDKYCFKSFVKENDESEKESDYPLCVIVAATQRFDVANSSLVARFGAKGSDRNTASWVHDGIISKQRGNAVVISNMLAGTSGPTSSEPSEKNTALAVGEKTWLGDNKGNNESAAATISELNAIKDAFKARYGAAVGNNKWNSPTVSTNQLASMTCKHNAHKYERNDTSLSYDCSTTGYSLVRAQTNLTINGTVNQIAEVGDKSGTSNNHTLVINAGDNNVTIEKDLILSQPDAMIVILAKNIYIGPEVRQIDAILIADDMVNTCYIGDGGIDNVNYDSCKNKITFNAPVITNKIALYRTTDVRGGSAAETFNYDMRNYIWAFHQSRLGETMTTSSVKELSPRY